MADGVFCATCGRPVSPGADRYCAQCGAMVPGNYDKLPPLPPPPVSRSPTSVAFRPWRYLAFGVVLLIVLGVIGQYLEERGVNLVAEPSVSDPLAGTVVFGDSFDDDITLSGQRRTASLGETTVWVAHAREVQPKGSVMVSYLIDGTPLVSVPTEVGSDWMLVGSTLPTLGMSPGNVLMVKVSTIGNELIAVGSVTITE